MAKTLLGTLLERKQSIPKGLTGCEEIGMSGSCMNNCYICSDVYGFDMSDEEIVDLFGIEQQQKMLRDYERWK